MKSISETIQRLDVFGNLPRLETDRLILRKMRLEDAQDMFEYASDPEVSRFTLWDYHKTIEDSLAFLSCVLKGYEEHQIENWGIVYKENGKFIGTCGYFFWDIEHARAEVQYALSRAYWGKGLMPEALNAVIAFGFTTMNLNRIEAKCIVDNAASERVMQKASMHFEGILHEALYAKGSYHDVKLYAILRKDWEWMQQAKQSVQP